MKKKKDKKKRVTKKMKDTWADLVFGPVDPKTGTRKTFAVIGNKTGGKW